MTAEKQGVHTAAFFWPGTATKIGGVRPTYWYEYDGSVPNATRIDQVLTWLDLPESRRPRLITTYFSITDDVGHEYGPDSPEIVAAIQEIDGLIGRLLHGLRQRDLLDRVNVIIVSDHGMCPISPEHVVYLDDYIDMQDVDVVDWNPVAALNPAPGKESKVYRALVHANPHMEVYRKSEVPVRFHYRENPRIPKIVAIAQEGWSITSHSTVKPHYVSGGNHGFDNRLESMGAIFIAFGPAFRSGLTVEPFQNIHIYELMAHILGLRPAPNDGSLDSVKVMLRQDAH
ncbi:MAG: alkaline phosphatase family protein [Calditrichaeota bacterium]|nr:MAG: alkaline phosphatase family protein [Calditrichota bacterium]